MCFNNVAQINSPTHQACPYAFKVYAIERAKALGYDIVIWCDSPQRLVQSPVAFIQTIEQVGVYLQRDGWTTGQWANDKALAYFKVTRDAAMQIPAIYACIMGVDFRHAMTKPFLTQWKAAALAGIFHGNWHNRDKTESADPRCRGHRHDQTCAELIAHQLHLPLQPLVVNRIFKAHTDIETQAELGLGP